jgi:hypothetical protein
MEERTPLSGLQHLTIRDAPDPALPKWDDLFWGEDVHDTIIVVLGAIFEDCKDLRSITWITKLDADQIQVFVDGMKEDLEDVEPTCVVKDDGEMTLRWGGGGWGTTERSWHSERGSPVTQSIMGVWCTFQRLGRPINYELDMLS